MSDKRENAKIDKLLKASEISIHIDHYDDIFSDFDSRPYSIRALSDDFLLEVRKAAHVKPSGELELRFIIPKKMQNGDHESLVRKRLKDYFKKHGDLIKKEIRKIRLHGLKFIIIGAACSVSAAYLLYSPLFELPNP